MRTSFISLILLLLLGACSRPEVTERLAHAERIMNAHPDSALQLLRAIDAPHKLRGKERADYAWLLTQAYDKNYLDSLQSDSLIALATDYYADNADAVRAGKAFFYQGKVLALQGKDSLAMVSYLEAGRRLENTDEYQFKARVQEYIGHLYKAFGKYDMASNFYNKATSSYKFCHDSIGIAHCYSSISGLYWNQQRYDSVYKYVNIGLSHIKHDSTQVCFSSFMQMLGVVSMYKKDYASAISYYEAAIKTCKIPHSLLFFKMSLGEIYIEMGKLDLASKYFQEILSTTSDLWGCSGANHYLHKIEKLRGNYAKSIYYKGVSDSLLAIYNKERSASKIYHIQYKTDTDYLKHKNDQLIQEASFQFYLKIGIIIISLIIIVFIYFYGREKIMEKEEVISQQTIDINEREQQILSYADDIEILKQKIKRIDDKSILVKDDLCAGGVYLLDKLKQKKLVLEHMTPIEFKQLFAYIDLMHHNFATRLKTEYLLNEKNLCFAIFLLLGFEDNDIAFIFSCATESIKRKKLRLKSTLGLPKEGNLYEGLLKISLSLSDK